MMHHFVITLHMAMCSAVGMPHLAGCGRMSTMMPVAYYSWHCDVLHVVLCIEAVRGRLPLLILWVLFNALVRP
jgi:hypothetical protein